MSLFIQEFKSTEDIVEQYETDPGALDGATVHLAWYGYGDADGDSLVIFEKDGKLYEVNGSHCSCHGLEGQWEPEETSWAALGMRNLCRDFEGSEDAQKALNDLVRQHLPKSAPTREGGDSGHNNEGIKGS